MAKLFFEPLVLLINFFLPLPLFLLKPLRHAPQGALTMRKLTNLKALSLQEQVVLVWGRGNEDKGAKVRARIPNLALR